MMDPAKVAFWIPTGLRNWKLTLFDKVAHSIQARGGRVVKHDELRLADLPDDVVPIVGCHPPLKAMIEDWRARGRTFIYWDRGYLMRWFATCLPKPATMEASFYRWHVNAYQMPKILDVPDDRWRRLKTDVQPWQKGGRHIVIAAPTANYARLHGCENWLSETITALAKVTDRQLVVRDKEHFRKRPLQADLAGAHALVTHGSNAANEAIILGCPVFSHKSCAASLVGHTDLNKIEAPAYPDRQPWLNSLAYTQFHERELLDGTLWRLMT